MFKEISFAAPTLLSQVSGDRKHTFLMLKVIAARPIPIALYCCLWPMIPWHLYDCLQYIFIVSEYKDYTFDYDDMAK